MYSEIILQVVDLKKYYGKVHAVDGVSLSVIRGQIFGFLGPNGSGKTTTIGMILGLIHPTAGKVTVFGKTVSPSQTKPLREVGALVGAPALVPYLSARQNLKLIARFYPAIPDERIDEIFEIVDLTVAADRRSGEFSTGMKQRLGLGMALLHRPDLLVLDEPTNGMDPAGMRDIRNLIIKLAGQGVTVFISSHLLHEVEQICDHVAVLKQGRIIAEGEVKDLLGKMTSVRVRVPSPNLAADCLKTLKGINSIKTNGAYLSVSGVSGQEVIAHLTANQIIPSEVTSGGADLESIFLELTENQSKEL
jgi:ABC-2 type transport system ATP-binding protein